MLFEAPVVALVQSESTSVATSISSEPVVSIVAKTSSTYEVSVPVIVFRPSTPVSTSRNPVAKCSRRWNSNLDQCRRCSFICNWGYESSVRGIWGSSDFFVQSIFENIPADIFLTEEKEECFLEIEQLVCKEVISEKEAARNIAEEVIEKAVEKVLEETLTTVFEQEQPIQP